MTVQARRGCGQTRMAGAYTDQRLNLSKLWEGPRKKCQGFKPDPGNPAVRDYRGASGNVSHGGNVHPSCNRKSGKRKPPTYSEARPISIPIAHKMLVLVPAASARLNSEVMRVAVAPAEGTGELGHREQLNGVDAEVEKIRQQIHRVLQRSRARAAGAKRVHVQFVHDQIFNAARHRHARPELVHPELRIRAPRSRGII